MVILSTQPWAETAVAVARATRTDFMLADGPMVFGVGLALTEESVSV